MELPDCPPGAEGYQDTVVEVPKKPEYDDGTSTKAEQAFKEHLSGLKIKVEDGTTRCMVERKGRDVSGKWIYLCFPCEATCGGEVILQTHISGKKHKARLSLKNVWPISIFEEHPYIKNEKGTSTANQKNPECNDTVLKKMAEETSKHQENEKLDSKYAKYRQIRAQIQETLDKFDNAIVGIEYLVEFLPEEAHYEPTYICLLCNKQGAPRTIVNHLMSFWHRIHYLWRHYPTAHGLLQPYRSLGMYREGVGMVLNKLMQRIEQCHGRLKPLCIDKHEFNKERERIIQWVFQGPHFTEKNGQTFAEVVDVDLILSLARADGKDEHKKKDPSPPVVPAPTRNVKPEGREPMKRERRRSVCELSDDLSEDERDRERRRGSPRPHRFGRDTAPFSKRFRRSPSPRRSSYDKFPPKREIKPDKAAKAPNYEYKLKISSEQITSAEQNALKILAYHEKNPEKHPLYPEEWKKFWNKRYKELQAEGKDATKHDFKPEWIVFWTKRMKELHKEDLIRDKAEIYRRLNMSPPHDRSNGSPPRRKSRSRSPGWRGKSPSRPSYPRRSPPRRRSRSPPPPPPPPPPPRPAAPAAPRPGDSRTARAPLAAPRTDRNVTAAVPGVPSPRNNFHQGKIHLFGGAKNKES